MDNRLVTLVGGSGFLGRYAVRALLKAGWRVRIVERDPRKAWYLKSQGNLGQTQFVAADIRKPATVARALQGSDAVVNFVGILKGDFEAFHVEGAANVAEAAAAAGAESLVHISAIGADAASASAYGRSKAAGEARVRAAFPGATILRPSIVFGREDQFINRFAAMQSAPVVPVLRSAVKFQPVFAGDVARAVRAAVEQPGDFAGKTFELGGPDVLSMMELQRWIASETHRAPNFVEVPDSIGGALAKLTGWLPGAPITVDQWLMLQHDNVVAPGADGLGALGVAATPLAAVAPGWLVLYQRNGRFGRKSAA
ncbi:complex I NDUFA9 subunit family protein [Sphingomonas sanxanigenens]|uniref:complex I NDUFA9 subunit family protein n=1 Tax=Sphingomonas sanxanigenens TaxID=397260 RepID=UPI00046CAB9A|nr:complex I NDUFA9 subunit family protein [Sphingomonas sanxanigenens]